MIFDIYIDFAKKKQTNINKQDNQITILTVTKKHKKKLFQWVIPILFQKIKETIKVLKKNKKWEHILRKSHKSYLVYVEV